VLCNSVLQESTAGEVPGMKGHGRWKKKSGDVADEALNVPREATTLDRVHAAMLLQASGRAKALQVLLKSERDCGPDFLCLANAFSPSIQVVAKKGCSWTRFSW
jgi:hypothetical protein